MAADNAQTLAAVARAVARGFQPVPIRDGSKVPFIRAWTQQRWDSPEQAVEAFRAWGAEGANGVGLLLGEPSGGLIDVDIDNPRATRLKDYFLPPTPMRSGRPGRPASHYWYRIEPQTGSDGKPLPLPSTRRHRMPGEGVSVEFRSTGSQTLVPPSVHPSGERYRWEGEPWGGSEGPRVIDPKVLSAQVALLAAGAVLLDNWPERGGRHDAYLALAGALLRFGDGVSPWWERNLPVLIRALADATGDDDGPDAREKEVMGSTLAKLRAPDSDKQKVTGFPTLARIIGDDHVKQLTRLVRDVEALAGPDARPTVKESSSTPLSTREHAESGDSDEEQREDDSARSDDPLTWGRVDLDPHLAGEVLRAHPTVLERDDGVGLFYSGKVNSLYGRSEAAKSWIALVACQQEMTYGRNVVYVDLEDDPALTIERLRLLGSGDDDIRNQFVYVRPDEPLGGDKGMHRNRWGQEAGTKRGKANDALWTALLDSVEPSLIVVDGMMVLYGLHGLDSNDGMSTEVITGWLKRMTRGGRTTVLVIDHTGKGAARGSSPIGAHHKIAMVQGASLQAHPLKQPMPGERGEVELIVAKDRPGLVRAASTRTSPAVAARVILDSRPSGVRQYGVDDEGNPTTTKPSDPEGTYVAIVRPDPDDVVIEVSDKAHEKAERATAAKAEAARLRLAARAQELEDDCDAILALFGGDLDLGLWRSTIETALGDPTPARRVPDALRALTSGDDRRITFDNPHYRLTAPEAAGPSAAP